MAGWPLAAFGEKILDFDVMAATHAGRIEAKAISAGHDPGMADAMIAGIAAARGLVVITHNERHFRPLGIDVRAPTA